MDNKKSNTYISSDKKISTRNCLNWYLVPTMGVLFANIALIYLVGGTWSEELRWLEIPFVFFTSTLFVISAYCISYHYSFRCLPSLAIASAWAILISITITVISNYKVVSFVSVVNQSYSNLSSDFVKTFLQIYSIGIFGTVLLSLATEAAKSLWSDEVRNTENKNILVQFKRVRRQAILYRKVPTIGLVGIIYLHILFYIIGFITTFLIVAVLGSGDSTKLKTNLVLLLLSITFEVAGIGTHFTVTDHSLLACEMRYLKQLQPRIEKRLTQITQEKNPCFDQEIGNFFQVLVHSYCNHGALSNTCNLAFFPKLQKNAKYKNTVRFAIAKELIRRFYWTKRAYIDPNNEEYYINIRKNFEYCFAQDLTAYLCQAEVVTSTSNASPPLTAEFPSSELKAIALCVSALFDRQRDEWEQWLYPSRISFNCYKSILLIDYVYYRYLGDDVQLQPGRMEGKTAIGAMLMSFPYVMELHIRAREEADRKGKPFFVDQNRFLFDAKEDTSENDTPNRWYQARVEQYYWELYRLGMNSLPKETCDKVGSLFYSFLRNSYHTTEPYLHRILPINSRNYTATDDVPLQSIMFSMGDLLKWLNNESEHHEAESSNSNFNSEPSRYVLPGWKELFDKAVSSVRKTNLPKLDVESHSLEERILNIITMPNRDYPNPLRLSYYDLRNDEDRRLEETLPMLLYRFSRAVQRSGKYSV